MGSSDITGIHHVGLIVDDMGSAISTFRQLGFRIDAPAYPALPTVPGGPPEPIGAGNTHADFPRSFIELLALAPDSRQRLPTGARLVPLQVPDDQVTATRAAVERTVGNLATRLDRSEGAHILVFATRDAEQTAARLQGSGVGHGGARALQRPITTTEGTELAAIKFLEINDDDPAMPLGMVPEGRVGAAEDAPPDLLDAQTGLAHPNGAGGLSECVLCVDDQDLRSVGERYERYLGIPLSLDGPTPSFDLGSSRLTLTTRAGLAARLPGEEPRTTPALVAYTVEVADLAAAEDLLRDRGVGIRRSADGLPFIPAKAALGAAIILRQAREAG